jgi:hypothetical protein
MVNSISKICVLAAIILLVGLFLVPYTSFLKTAAASSTGVVKAADDIESNDIGDSSTVDSGSSLP